MTSRCAGKERERKDTVERERESFPGGG